MLQEGFVYIKKVIPNLIESIRYAETENFLGCKVDGYLKPIGICTVQAAESLLKVSNLLKSDYSLVLYDAYRPVKAVKHFCRWSLNIKDDVKRLEYFPFITKEQIVSLGFVSTGRSKHSLGSAIDLSLVPKGSSLTALQKSPRTLTNGQNILFLDDGTLDMGVSFDYFGDAALTETNRVSIEAQKNRMILKQAMESCGFKNYKNEWWHFDLIENPHEDDFDFDVA